ncbi:MAG: CBS domain-containing protein [Candidatus Hadarchaeaceae archaeon]|nr:CBS domain-containing protein [Hadesarchaea archaeon]MDH5685460.1 CBS domain-containing protein [Hadesarchaea archaeon]
MRILRLSEVKAMRTRLGLSQKQLAELAGVTQAYISKIEARTVDPRVSTLEKISKALERATAMEKRANVGQIMTSPIVAVKSDDRVDKAIHLMKSYDISQLPVLDEEVQVGSISEATVMQRIASGENMARLLKRNVRDIMENSFPTVSKDTDIDVVYSLLEHEPAIIVVAHGKVTGIVTKADLFKLAGKPRGKS